MAHPSTPLREPEPPVERGTAPGDQPGTDVLSTHLINLTDDSGTSLAVGDNNTCPRRQGQPAAEWRPVPGGYVGLYECCSSPPPGRVRSTDREIECSDGSVKRLKGRELRPSYGRVQLSVAGARRTYAVSTLVALAFGTEAPR